MNNINGLSKQEIKDAIAMGEANLDALKPEARPAVIERIQALRERLLRIEATETKIAMRNRALARNSPKWGTIAAKAHLLDS